MAGLPWVAPVANKVAAAARVAGVAAATTTMEGGATAAVAGDAAAGGGEEMRTLGLKACPPRVFTMVRQEEERRWRGEFQTGNGDLK